MMGGFAQASTTFKLPAGSYVVRAYNENGKDGTLLLWDTKTFTVGLDDQRPLNASLMRENSP